jgi:hypothetical protein
MNNWELEINHERYVVSLDTIRQWAMEGRVLADDRVRAPGHDWSRACDAHELKPLFYHLGRPAAIPPPPPPLPPPRAFPVPMRTPPRQGASPVTLILVAAAIVAVVGGGIGFAIWKGVKNFKPANYNRVMAGYSLKGDETVSFVQLTLPKGWRPTTGLNKIAQVQAINPSKGAFLLIITEELNRFSPEEQRQIAAAPLENFGEYALGQIRSSLDDLTVTEKSMVKLGGHPAFQQIADARYQGQPVKMFHIVIRGLYGMHQLILWTPAANFSETKTQFEGILENFREVNEKNYKYSYRLTEIGEIGEVLFLSDRPIEGPTGKGVQDKGEGRGLLETDTDRKFTVNGWKFTVREDGILQGRNFWPEDATNSKRMIVRLDKLDEAQTE